MNVEMLAARSGVTVRNIRAYQTAGLLPPPRLQGRLGLYDAEHLGKLELIRELRQQGFGLDAIREMLAHTPDGAWPEYSLVSHLFSKSFFTVEPAQRKAIAEMATHWGKTASAAQKERLAQNGLYRPIGDDAVEMLSPSLERIGIQLAELGVSLDTVLDLQDELIRHTRSIAKTYVEQLFLGLIQTVTRGKEGAADASVTLDAELISQLRALFERLRPLAIGSVSAAFPVVLQQEFDRGIQKRLKQRKKSR
ncbi:MAG: MerR family transcriptional regulator [Burkholderiales bacterium]|nr:MerR family transcriptional regulator [Burkholderiales bacterium]